MCVDSMCLHMYIVSQSEHNKYLIMGHRHFTALPPKEPTKHIFLLCMIYAWDQDIYGVWYKPGSTLSLKHLLASLPIHVCVCRVTFQFKSSKRSNNGTDVGSGQIPELLYRLPELESEEGEELQLLGREFSSTVSPVSRKNTPSFQMFLRVAK